MKLKEAVLACAVSVGACSQDVRPAASGDTAPRPVIAADTAVALDVGECPVDSGGRYSDPVALVQLSSDSDGAGGTMGGG